MDLERSRRIVLADKHVVFLDGLTTALSQAGFEVLAAATTAQGLLEDVRLHQPDICVIETQFPDGGGVEAIAELTTAHPNTKIVVLTADDHPDTMRVALDAGASGYVFKSRGVERLLDVLRRVLGGDTVVEGSVQPNPLRADRYAPPQLLRLATYLTRRELECLALLAEGLDTTAMAHRLSVSRATVRSHVQAVLTKLGVHSRLEAASLAIRFGLVAATTDERKRALG